MIQHRSFVNVGEKVQDLVLPDLEGKPVALSEYHGRKLVVFMWASW